MDTSAHTRELDAVRRRRVELRETLDRLEAVLAAPASGRAANWGEEVLAAIAQLRIDFAEHVEVTEGPDGLHQSILSGDLRLANAVAALTTEHVVIGSDIAELEAFCAPAVAQIDVGDVRERGTQLLGRLSRHRQRGADLIYEAYETDIGGAG